MQNMQRGPKIFGMIWYDVVNVNKMLPKNPDMTHDTWQLAPGFLRRRRGRVPERGMKTDLHEI